MTDREPHSSEPVPTSVPYSVMPPPATAEYPVLAVPVEKESLHPLAVLIQEPIEEQGQAPVGLPEASLVLPAVPFLLSPFTLHR